MADHSKIEWTDATWNPVTGCSVVSPGCTNCYAMRLAGTRLKHHPSRAGLTRDTKAGPVWTGEVRTNWDWIDQPLRWAKPRQIFVCAHGDLFHEGVPDEDVAQIYGVMIAAHHLRGHIFQALTKRPSRARELLTSDMFWDQAMAVADSEIMDRTDPLNRRSNDARATCGTYDGHNPPPGIWLGTSVEDQARADERIPELLATPAAIHFASAEPLLGPIRFDRIDDDVDTFEDCGGHPDPHWPSDTHDATWLNALTGQMEAEARAPDGTRCGSIDVGLRWKGGKLDWIIVGGENGPRMMQAEWAQAIRDQCSTADTAFFFKQWGSHIPAGQTMANGKVWAPACGTRLRATKDITGRLLDGVEHNAMPRTGR